MRNSPERPRLLDTADTIADLQRENTGLKLKVSEYKRFKANYQKMREIYRMEQDYRRREKGMYKKAMKAFRNIANAESTASKEELQEYAKKMLDVLDYLE